MKRKTMFICALLCLLLCQSSYGLDRRLKLMFKTAAYGAGAGALIGGAVTALGVGDARNIFMGASSGMYAGILLAAYIVMTPPDRSESLRQNPYAPRRRVGPNDWENEGWDEEDFQQNMDPYNPDNTMRFRRTDVFADENQVRKSPQLLVWMPIVSVGF